MSEESLSAIAPEVDQLQSAIQRGFLLWSWIGLLGAYTSTSAVYGAQLLSIMVQGIDRFEFSSLLSSLTFAALMLPIMILTIGWLLFSRYSRVIFRTAVILSDGGESDTPLLRERLELLFTMSISYLVFSWVTILIVILLPYASMLVLRRL